MKQIGYWSFWPAVAIGNFTIEIRSSILITDAATTPGSATTSILLTPDPSITTISKSTEIITQETGTTIDTDLDYELALSATGDSSNFGNATDIIVVQTIEVAPITPVSFLLETESSGTKGLDVNQFRSFSANNTVIVRDDQGSVIPLTGVNSGASQIASGGFRFVVQNTTTGPPQSSSDSFSDTFTTA
jgi:hypothetical protein